MQSGRIRLFRAPARSRGFVESFMRLTRGLPNGLFDNGAFAVLSGAPVQRARAHRRLPQARAQAVHRRHRSRQRQVGAVRRAGLRPRADLRGGQGERGAAGPLSARAHRRPRLCRRRAEEDAARVRRAEGRREAPHLHQSARALRRRPAPRARPAPSRSASPIGASSPCSRRPSAPSSIRACGSAWGATPEEFPDADVVLFEPAQDDEVIFFANIFSYADRRRLAEHAYRHTLSELETARARTRADLRPARSRARPLRSKGRRPGPRRSLARQGKLWDSVKPLEKTLGELEKALSRDKPGRSEGVKRDAAKAAPPDA